MARRSNSKFAVTAVGRDQVSPAMRKAGQSFVDMARAAAASGKKVSSSMGRANRSMRAMAKSSSILTGALERVGHRSVDAVGRAVVGAARAMIEGVKAAQEYQKAIAEVQTISTDSALTTERIKDITSELSRAYGTSLQANAKALYQTISAGTTDAAGATELLHTAAKLSIGGITEMTTAVDGLTNVVNSYRASGLTAADAADTMFVAVRDGKTTIEELSTNMGAVTPIASKLGVSFAEVSAAVATITTSGVATAEAVTQVRSILTGVAKQTPKSQAAAKQLGIDFSLTALKAKGLKKFLQEIANSGATETQIIRLFGRVEAFGGVLALTSEDSAKFNQILKDMEGRAGAADGAFAKMSQEMSFQTDKFTALKDEASKTFGAMAATSKPALKLIKGLNTALTQMIDFFKSSDGREVIDAFFKHLHTGLIVAVDATRSMVRALAFMTRVVTKEGSTSLRKVADELFEIQKSLEMGKQGGFDSTVQDRLNTTIAKKNVEAFQEIIATRKALGTTLKDESVKDKFMHLSRIVDLEAEIDARRKVYLESNGNIQGLLDAEKKYAKEIMASKTSKDKDTKATTKNANAKGELLKVTKTLREMSGQAQLDRDGEKLRLEAARINMLIANEKRVDAIKDQALAKDKARQAEAQADLVRQGQRMQATFQSLGSALVGSLQQGWDDLQSGSKTAGAVLTSTLGAVGRSVLNTALAYGVQQAAIAATTALMGTQTAAAVTGEGAKTAAAVTGSTAAAAAAGTAATVVAAATVSGAVATVAANKLAAISSIFASASVAGAAAFSAYAGIPIAGPILGAAAAGLAYTTTAAFAAPVLALNKGGPVPGRGNRDTVPAMLTPGEFVIPSDLVSAIRQGRAPSRNASRTARQAPQQAAPPPQMAGPTFVLQTVMPTRQGDYEGILRDSIRPAYSRAGGV